MKDFDLFKFMAMALIVCVVIAAIGLIDFTGAISISEIVDNLQKPLEVKNWHYALFIILLLRLGGGNGTK